MAGVEWLDSGWPVYSKECLSQKSVGPSSSTSGHNESTYTTDRTHTLLTETLTEPNCKALH